MSQLAAADHRYDVFISYARKASTKQALALKRGLEKFNKKWSQPFSTRVFLDDKALVAAPSLKAAILAALSKSRFLAVLLTPAAANSQWVNEEIQWWLENREPETLILVHAAGDDAWTGDNFSGDSVIPPALRRLQDEPRWVDFTWFDAATAPESDPRMTDCVLEVFCPIHGLDRTDAVAANDRTVRRNKRLFRGGLAGLIGLLVVSLALAGTAYTQALEARSQARAATSRSLAAAARLTSPDNDVRALQLAVNAVGLDENPDSLAALYATWFGQPETGAQPQSGGSFDAPGQVTAVVYPAASGPVVGLDDGRVLRWDATQQQLVEIGSSGESVTFLSASNDGIVVAASSALRTVVLGPEKQLQGEGAGCVAHSGDQVVLGGEVMDLNTQRRVALSLPVPFFDQCAFSADDSSIAMLAGGGWLRVDAASGKVVAQQDWAVNYNYGYPVISPDGENFVHRMGSAPVANVYSASEPGDVRMRATVGPGIHALYTISDKGAFIATAGGRDIYFSETRAVTDPASSPWDAEPTDYRVLNGLGDATALALRGDGGGLVVAAGRQVAIWNVGVPFRGGAASDAPLPQPEGLIGRRMAVSPDGRHALVWTGMEERSEVFLIDGETANTVRLNIRLATFDQGIAWAEDSTAFAVLDFGGNPVGWYAPDGVELPSSASAHFTPARSVDAGPQRLGPPDATGVVHVLGEGGAPMFTFNEWDPAANSRGELQTLTQISANGATIYSVTSPDPKWAGQSIRVFAVDKNEVVRKVCSQLVGSSPMSDEDWERWAPGMARPQICR
ncbi:TIR domain-containing protein [Granulicoccus sp. GXG6511]|uniref:TIR domain-containing protein n=1 Tax=Granulicoccus sp. GXG6511 TaxID=3381351 RepID=UPI003D7E2B2F